jgi:hypothetical protein
VDKLIDTRFLHRAPKEFEIFINKTVLTEIVATHSSRGQRTYPHLGDRPLPPLRLAYRFDVSRCPYRLSRDPQASHAIETTSSDEIRNQ